MKLRLKNIDVLGSELTISLGRRVSRLVVAADSVGRPAARSFRNVSAPKRSSENITRANTRVQKISTEHTQSLEEFRVARLYIQRFHKI